MIAPSHNNTLEETYRRVALSAGGCGRSGRVGHAEAMGGFAGGGQYQRAQKWRCRCRRQAYCFAISATAGGEHHHRSLPALELQQHQCTTCVVTYLGDGIFESLRAKSSPSFTVVLGELRDASVDSAGNWSDALLPCLCSGGCECENDATVEQLDDGREMSRPTSSGLIDGSVVRSNAGGEVVLIAGRSKACSIDGRRNVSWACGRGRIEVASAEAVVQVGEKRGALLRELYRSNCSECSSVRAKERASDEYSEREPG
jgi:hypothetical protein